MTQSARRDMIYHAALGALACAIAIASLLATPEFAGVFGAALGLLMLAIAATDARSYVIPDELSLAAFVLGLAHAASGPYLDILTNAAAAAARGLVLAFVLVLLRAAYYRLRHRHGIGLGDIKLAAVAGVWLDVPFMLAAIEIAALAALACYAISRLLLMRPLEAAARVPFGLFFAPAIWFCWLGEVFAAR